MKKMKGVSKKNAVTDNSMDLSEGKKSREIED